MDVLKSLHTSVAQICEKAFDDAYRDLHAEIICRDSKVEEAEKKAKCAEEARDESAAETQELKHEILILREELLKETFSPQNSLIFGDNDAVCDFGLGSKKNESVKENYCALYNEFMTLLKATDGLRIQIKRHKRKLTYWRECLDRDKFTLVLDGIPVKFERTRKTLNGSQAQKPTSSHEAKPPFHFDEGLKKGGPKLHLKPPSTKSGGHCGLSSLDPERGLPNENTLPFEPGGVSTPNSTLPVPEDEVNGQKASFKADTLQQPHVSKKRPLKSYNPISGVPPSNNGATVRQTEHLSLLRKEQMPSGLLGGPSHRAKPHQTEDSNNTTKNADSPKERQFNNGLRHKVTPPTVLPSPLATADGNFRAPTANPGSSGYPTSYSPHSCPKSDHDGSPGPNRTHEKVPRRSLKHAISSIAEDSDKGNCKRRMPNLPRDGVSGTKSSHLHLSRDAPPTEKRLQELLESPLLPRNSLRPHRSIRAEVKGKNHGRHDRDFTKLANSELYSNPQSTPAPTEEMQVPSARPELPSELTSRADDCEASGMRPMNESYRARPVHELDLSHFKINPDYNQGLNFAYDDVVRKRHERESIQGCMRSDCCGKKFLAMARLGGVPNDPSQCGNDDRQIIEDYLGEEKGIIDRMATAEYQDILHEAKARLMANHYGRHKHHHQRPSTPPGFWRADMPDTQEMEHDHEAACEMEKEKVKERYRQAMRPGGLWKFADE